MEKNGQSLQIQLLLIYYFVLLFYLIQIKIHLKNHFLHLNQN
jgi:heme/copper-type cytochrome/quinol oxidase subunit 4